MLKKLTKDTMQDAVGKEIGVSDWFIVNQGDVDTFADVTQDQQFIHINPEYAAETPFGGTIAHGFLTLSMLTHFAANGSGVWIKDANMGVNYGFDKVRFVNPVRVGSMIRARSKLISATEKKPGQFLFKQEVTVEIDGVDKPALIAEWLTMAVIL